MLCQRVWFKSYRSGLDVYKSQIYYYDFIHILRERKQLYAFLKEIIAKWTQSRLDIKVSTPIPFAVLLKFIFKNSQRSKIETVWNLKY